ncbi:MAG: YcbK family protein [Burkholderiaceae bacterium]|jgi:uncharacterized protein YcbK (DUF882 family)
MLENRRSFIKAVSTLALVGVADSLRATGAWAQSANMPPPDLFDASLVDLSFWTQPRTLQLVRPQSGDRLELQYWKDGSRNPTAYAEICELLRDVQANQVTRMDPQLIDTLWAAQAFVRRYGFSAPIEITSGYRTPQTNMRLIEAGLPAARQSLHMQGKAADFRLNGLHPEILGTLIQGFKSGGVGFYFRVGSRGGGWIHADTGVERAWRG